MCLVLYISTASELAAEASPDLGVEAVEPRRAAVRQWFRLPNVRFVRAHGTCSCGFPHFIADEPVLYEEWLDPVLAQSDDRGADVRSVRALLGLLARYVRADGLVELYPVSDGSEHLPPKGIVQLNIEDLVAERFSFTEQFFYRVSSRSAQGKASAST